jgi:hypothetical protein
MAQAEPHQFVVTSAVRAAIDGAPGIDLALLGTPPARGTRKTFELFEARYPGADRLASSTLSVWWTPMADADIALALPSHLRRPWDATPGRFSARTGLVGW